MAPTCLDKDNHPSGIEGDAVKRNICFPLFPMYAQVGYFSQFYLETNELFLSPDSSFLTNKQKKPCIISLFLASPPVPFFPFGIPTTYM